MKFIVLVLGLAAAVFAQDDIWAEVENAVVDSSVAPAVADTVVAPLVPASTDSVAPAAATSEISAPAAPADSNATVPAPADSNAAASAIPVAPAGSSAGATTPAALADSSATVSADSAVTLTQQAQDSLLHAQQDSVQRDLTDSAAQAAMVGGAEVAPEISPADVAPTVAAPPPGASSRAEILGAVKVSRVRGIDELKGSYKSPRKALFMSLALPGAGQFYVGGNTFNKARGVAYLLTEAVLGSYWYYYSVHLYSKQVNKYEKFAQKHYSVGQYETSMQNLYGELSDVDSRANFANIYLISREEYCGAMYQNARSNKCYESGMRGDYFYTNQNHTSRYPATEDLGTSLAKNNFWDEQRFYQIIASDEYVLGWDDVTAVRSSSELDLTGKTYTNLAESQHAKDYKGLRKRANELADMQVWFLGGLLLNHLVSAVDAAVSAHAHNKKLYEEEVAWYQNMRLQSGFYWDQGLAMQVGAQWGF